MPSLTVSKFGAPGYVKDVAEYAIAPQAFNEVRNVRFNAVGAQTIGGESRVMSQAPIQPLWLKVFPPIENPLWLCADLAKVYAYDGNYNDITRLSGDYTGSTNERWQGEVLNGVGILNNVQDVPQQWTDFDASVRLENLAFWPSNLRCKALRPFKYFLMAMHTIDTGIAHPYRIRWSDAAEPGTVPSSWDISDPTKFAGEKDLADTDDYIVDGWKLGELFIVYKQKTAYAMQFIDRPDVFADWQIGNKGLLHRDCMQEIPGGHFVVGFDDIYVHRGTKGSEESVVENTLRNWVFNQIDSNNFYNCYTFNHSRRNEIYFCFPEAGEVYPTLALVWNRITGGIGIRDLFKSPFIYPGPILKNPDDDIWGGGGVETLHLEQESNPDDFITESGDYFILE